MSKISFPVISGLWLVLLLTLCNIAFAAQHPVPTRSAQHVVPLARNFNLLGALHGLTRGGNASASATGFYEINNPVAQASIGIGTVATGAACGEWAFGTIAGDPETKVDDNFPVIGAARASIYDVGAQNEQSIGETGIMMTQPYYNATTQTGGWTWNSDNVLSNYNVTLKISLVRDIMYYEYDIQNLNGDSRQVGLSLLSLLNTFSSAAGNPPTYYIPNVGSFNTVQLLTGSQVPDYWFLRDGTALVPPDNHPPLKFQQIFTNGNTRPAQLVFGNYDTGTTDDLMQYDWLEYYSEQTIAPTVPYLNNGDALSFYQGSTAYECMYPIVSIAPGLTSVVTGEIQLNWSAVNTLGQYPNQGVLAAAVRTPEWISSSANSMEVDGYVCNSASLFPTTATITIDPGSGFKFAAGQSATYQNVSVPEMQEIPVSWNLVPQWNVLSPQNAQNPLGYPVHLTATFSSGGSISTTSYINIPSVASQQGIPPGIHFLGWPFQFTNTLSTGVINNLSTDTLFAWNTASYAYQDGAQNPFAITPGNGYWFDNATSSPQPLNSTDTPTPIDQTQPFTLQLNPGWNAISNPYEYSIVWGYCQVMYNYQVYSLNDAVRIGLIREELWSWDENASPPAYALPSSSLTQQLIPNVGYWLYAGDAVNLMFMPNPYIAAMSPGTTTSSTSSTSTVPRTRTTQTNQWQINILAKAGNAVDRTTSFGVARNQQNGPSGGNIMKPPISPQGVSVYFPHTNWGRMSGQYAVELQAPATTNTWAMDVNCVQNNAQVNLSWPDLTGIPAKMPVIITDLTTGQQISMRTSPGYSFNSKKGEVRHFSITAGGVQTSLQFTQVQAMANRARGGTTINFALSADADVTLNLRTPTGRLIRSLETSNAVGGSNTIFWDGKDAQGRILPRGMYLCELYAEATDGQRVRASLTLSK